METSAAVGVEAARRLKLLDGRVCRVERGMSAAELARVEGEYGFEFADDHRAFLAAGLPVSVVEPDVPGVIRTYREPWPDWRDGDPATLRQRLEWPVEGVLFDVEHNVFWDEGWGERPSEVGAALEVARGCLASVPKLVPVYGHRYLPAGRGSSGHLVMSVWQTDIISYGDDLADYIDREFGQRRGDVPSARATVGFWGSFL
ncbi:MAG TPA: hypothetical protein VL551_24610 [Actinospica sp.]|nr:hypothetical protein [Actinospica sp.]